MTARLDVVILAAGKGKRMYSSRPKVLHRLGGRYLAQHVIDTARVLGAQRICVVYGHGGEAVRESLAAPDLCFALQEPQLGTGHAVLQALPHIDRDGRVLILYGDVPLTRLGTLQRLVAGDPADAVHVVTAVLVDPTGYGRIVRDARVAMIYEGTNEIQAIDLLVRKVLADGGQGLAALLTTLPGTAPSPAASARRHALVEITQTLAIAAQSDAELPYWVADDYLRAVALVLLDWAWCQIGAASHGERWNAPAQALTQWVLPEFDMRAAILRQRIAQSLEIKNKLAASA